MGDEHGVMQIVVIVSPCPCSVTVILLAQQQQIWLLPKLSYHYGIRSLRSAG